MCTNTRKENYKNTLSNKTALNDFVRAAKAAAPFEEKFHKELAEFNRDEIIEMMNSLEKTGVNSLKQHLNCIAQYQQFVGVADYDVLNNPVMKEDIDLVSAIRKHFFPSFDAVLNEITKVRLLTEGYPEPPLLGLAWLGVEAKFAGQIKVEDVDLINGCLYFEGKYGREKVSIDSSVLKVFRMFRGLAVAYRNSGKDYEVTPEDSPYFVRGMRSKNSKKKPKPYATSDITRMMSDLKTEAADNGKEIMDITYGNVQRSGELHRIYLLEKRGTDLNSPNGQWEACKLAHVSPNHVSELLYQYQEYKQAFNL